MANRRAIVERTAQLSKLAISLTSLGIGVWGAIAPRQLARVMGDDPALARTLAARDALIGAALLGSRSTLPLMARAAADVFDAVRLMRRSPRTAAAALGFGLCALTTAALMRRQRA